MPFLRRQTEICDVSTTPGHPPKDSNSHALTLFATLSRASSMVRGVGKFGVRGLKVAAFEMGEIVDPGFPNPFLYRPDLKDPNKGEGLLARGLFSAY